LQALATALHGITGGATSLLSADPDARSRWARAQAGLEYEQRLLDTLAARNASEGSPGDAAGAALQKALGAAADASRIVKQVRGNPWACEG
jgi:hypothetical protein